VHHVGSPLHQLAMTLLGWQVGLGRSVPIGCRT